MFSIWVPALRRCELHQAVKSSAASPRPGRGAGRGPTPPPGSCTHLRRRHSCTARRALSDSWRWVAGATGERAQREGWTDG
ncbi:rCG30539 [Rattus norvegicus]|uniref:RCG30539 n=1 Tax=Rattus norvegicus TaxID=10116 RepID=A6KN32_RAT|nr:rCG30539 [Rattus norvegicus]